MIPIIYKCCVSRNERLSNICHRPVPGKFALVRMFVSLEFFLNAAELSLNSVNSGNLINHRNMNWAQFKDPVSHTHVSCWCCGSILISCTRGGRFEPF